jgi:hypothetical protein
MTCPYCDEPDKYGLGPAIKVEVNQTVPAVWVNTEWVPAKIIIVEHLIHPDLHRVSHYVGIRCHKDDS